MFLDITGLNCWRMILIQLNSVGSVHSEQKLDTTKNKTKIFSLLLSLHRVICIFILYFLRFCGFCHLNFETTAQSTAGCRQARSLGVLRGLLGHRLGSSRGLRCCRVCVGAALGVPWQGCLLIWVSCGSGCGHWLPADPGTGDTELGKEGREDCCQTAPAGAVQECAEYSLEQCFSARWDLAVSQQDKLFACF